MLRKVIKKTNNRKGFTLVELIIVVAILGVLAAVAVPSYQGYQTTAKINANVANMATIQNAINVYIANEGGLPDTLGDIVSAIEGDKYLGTTIPVPRIVSDDDDTAKNPGEAVTGDFYQMDDDGKVTIGQDDDQTPLSGEAVK